MHNERSMCTFSSQQNPQMPPFGEHVHFTLRFESGPSASRPFGLSECAANKGAWCYTLCARHVAYSHPCMHASCSTCMCEPNTHVRARSHTCEGMTKPEAPPISKDATLAAEAITDILVPAILRACCRVAVCGVFAGGQPRNQG